MMEANKTRISLATAKLLKDCGPKTIRDALSEENYIIDPYEDKVYPAYTWQEILWEYAGKFFHSSNLGRARLEFDGEWHYNHIEHILNLLQQKKYQEADEYFRKNNNLIK